MNATVTTAGELIAALTDFPTAGLVNLAITPDDEEYVGQLYCEEEWRRHGGAYIGIVSLDGSNDTHGDSLEKFLGMLRQIEPSFPLTVQVTETHERPEMRHVSVEVEHKGPGGTLLHVTLLAED